MNVSIEEICRILGHEIYEKYTSVNESIIKSSDWNDSKNGVTSFHIAMYMFIHQPSFPEEVNNERFSKIMIELESIFKLLLDEIKNEYTFDYFTLNNDENLSLYERHMNYFLGDYAKYFIRHFRHKDEITNEIVRDTMKRYLMPTDNRYMPLILDFIEETNKMEIKEMYAEVKRLNHNYKRQVTTKELNTIISNELFNRLTSNGMSITKAKRVSLQAVSAIKSS